MNNQQQFEAWYLENWGCTEDNHDSLFEESPHGGEYYRFGVRLAWTAWQAASKASEQQLSESRREFTAANATIHNLELKVEQVVAENAALKNFISTDCFVAHIEPETFYEEEVTRYVSADGYEPETPATDAAITNLRAQGVDEIAELYFTLAAHEANGSIADSWRESARFARDHAAQLRQGAEHE